MVNGNTPKNLQELYKFYNKDNSFYPPSPPPIYMSQFPLPNHPHPPSHPMLHPPKVYLNPSILLLSEKLDISLYYTLESIQEGEVKCAWPTYEQYEEINDFFNMDKAAGSCSTTTKVFKKISEGLNNINEPINQFLNQDSLYDFRNISNLLDRTELPIEHDYYLYQKSGGWSYSPGIFILKYGEEQPLFLNWRESPF